MESATDSTWKAGLVGVLKLNVCSFVQGLQGKLVCFSPLIGSRGEGSWPRITAAPVSVRQETQAAKLVLADLLTIV